MKPVPLWAAASILASASMVETSQAFWSGASHLASAGRSVSRKGTRMPMITAGTPSRMNSQRKPSMPHSPCIDSRADEMGAPMALARGWARMNRPSAATRSFLGNHKVK